MSSYLTATGMRLSPATSMQAIRRAPPSGATSSPKRDCWMGVKADSRRRASLTSLNAAVHSAGNSSPMPGPRQTAEQLRHRCETISPQLLRNPASEAWVERLSAHVSYHQSLEEACDTTRANVPEGSRMIHNHCLMFLTAAPRHASSPGIGEANPELQALCTDAIDWFANREHAIFPVYADENRRLLQKDLATLVDALRKDPHTQNLRNDALVGWLDSAQTYMACAAQGWGSQAGVARVIRRGLELAVVKDDTFWPVRAALVKQMRAVLAQLAHE